MNVFFDNCTAPVLASTLHAFICNEGHAAKHIKDMPCGRHAKDEDWIAMLGTSTYRWIVVTGDRRIGKSPPLRRAFREAELFGFVLAPAYQRTPMNQVASLLLWRWPEMRQIANLVGGAALYGLPINRHSKIHQLPL